ACLARAGGAAQVNPRGESGRPARPQAKLAGAAIIVPGRNMAGQIGEAQWKQEPNFWYLTGVESPFAILVMTPQSTVVFLPLEYQFASGQYPGLEPGFRRAPWNRLINRLYPGPAAAKRTRARHFQLTAAGKPPT